MDQDTGKLPIRIRRIRIRNTDKVPPNQRRHSQWIAYLLHAPGLAIHSDLFTEGIVHHLLSSSQALRLYEQSQFNINKQPVLWMAGSGLDPYSGALWFWIRIHT